MYPDWYGTSGWPLRLRFSAVSRSRGLHCPFPSRPLARMDTGKLYIARRPPIVKRPPPSVLRPSGKGGPFHANFAIQLVRKSCAYSKPAAGMSNRSLHFLKRLCRQCWRTCSYPKPYMHTACCLHTACRRNASA